MISEPLMRFAVTAKRTVAAAAKDPAAVTRTAQACTGDTNRATTTVFARDCTAIPAAA